MLLENKVAAVIGLARAGIPAAKFLAQKGAKVRGYDSKKTEEFAPRAELESLGVELFLGDHGFARLEECEHTFYRQPLAGQVWHQAGGGKEQPRCVRHTASDTKRRTVAALNASTGQVTWHGCSRSRARELQLFLKKLRKT